MTNGSLSKVLEGKNNYKDKEEFDLVIVDEAHGFRSDNSGKYDELQKICKSPCLKHGFVEAADKESDAAFCHSSQQSPRRFAQSVAPFQNSQSCTIDGIPNLKKFFTPLMRSIEK